MDPTDKKRAQPANPEYAAAPPPKRRQMSSAAPSAADEQSAAASGHPTAMAAAAAAPFPVAASAASASTRPAGLADSASSAASLLSPAQRCPSDPLSVAFSFLDTRDFAVASRICRHWRRAAELQSAWPEFSVERLISGLIEDDRHWIHSRSLRLNADRLRVGELERAALIPKWRRLVGLHVYSSSTGREEEYKWVTLGRAALLPHLQSLRLEKVRLDDVDAAFRSMAPRLLAFDKAPHCARNVVQLYLHLLVNLRALALDDIEGQSLLSLHQLEYLQLCGVASCGRDLLLAIRRLSVQHRLRHLSLGSIKLRTIYLPALAERSGPDQLDIDIAPAALVSVRLHCALTDASHSALLSLPSLTRLSWTGDATFGSVVHRQSPLPLSPFQLLYLDKYFNERGAVQLLQQAAIRAPQLRELHIACPPPSFYQLVRCLRSLRLLDVTMWKSLLTLPLELMQALASLPLFSELVVRQDGWRPTQFHLISEMLRSISESPSWRLIRLIGRFNHPQLTLPTDVDARLAERLVDLRVQVEWPGTVRVHRLVVGAPGRATWQQTAV